MPDAIFYKQLQNQCTGWQVSSEKHQF